MSKVTKSLYVFLVFGMLASVALWMPFGAGYYGVPWDKAECRAVLYLFVFALPVCGLAECLLAFHGGLSWWRLALSLAALFTGLFGVFVMLDWLGRVHPPLSLGH